LHHRDQRWETFTEEVIKLVCKERPRVVFCLWARPPSAARSTGSETSRRPSTAHPSEWA